MTTAASDKALTHSTHVITSARRRRSAGTVAKITPAAARSAAEPTATLVDRDVWSGHGVIVASAAPLHRGYGYSTLRELHTPLGDEACRKSPADAPDLAVAAALDRLLRAATIRHVWARGVR